MIDGADLGQGALRLVAERARGAIDAFDLGVEERDHGVERLGLGADPGEIQRHLARLDNAASSGDAPFSMARLNSPTRVAFSISSLAVRNSSIGDLRTFCTWPAIFLASRPITLRSSATRVALAPPDLEPGLEHVVLFQQMAQSSDHVVDRQIAVLRERQRGKLVTDRVANDELGRQRRAGPQPAGPA